MILRATSTFGSSSCIELSYSFFKEVGSNVKACSSSNGETRFDSCNSVQSL